MPRTRTLRLALGLFVASASLAGCDLQKLGVGPTAIPGTGDTSLLGTWSSDSLTVPGDGKACGSFQWTIVTQSATEIGGTFSASCLGTISLSGNATGRLNGNTMDIAVSGAASLAGISCSFSITGTGTFQDDTIRVPYNGTTCLGPVSGTETLRRGTLPGLPGPPQPPAPPPPPPPPPPGSGIPCALGDGEDIVDCVASRWPERLVPTGSLGERQDNMKFLRDRIIEAGKCSGMDLGWNLKRGGPEISIDFLTWQSSGGLLGIDIAVDYDNIGKTLELQWLIGTFPYYAAYPAVNCG
jgi:hypothetical protein